MTYKQDKASGVVFSFAFLHPKLASGPAQFTVHKQMEELDSGQSYPTLNDSAPLAPLSSGQG